MWFQTADYRGPKCGTIYKLDMIVHSSSAVLQVDQSVVPIYKVDIIIHSGSALLQGDQSVVPIYKLDMTFR